MLENELIKAQLETNIIVAEITGQCRPAVAKCLIDIVRGW